MLALMPISALASPLCCPNLGSLVSHILDVERELPKLATYLGHVHINDTYWYLEAVPELLQLATDRLIPREVRP